MENVNLFSRLANIAWRCARPRIIRVPVSSVFIVLITKHMGFGNVEKQSRKMFYGGLRSPGTKSKIPTPSMWPRIPKHHEHSIFHVLYARPIPVKLLWTSLLWSMLYEWTPLGRTGRQRPHGFSMDYQWSIIFQKLS